MRSVDTLSNILGNIFAQMVAKRQCAPSHGNETQLGLLAALSGRAHALHQQAEHERDRHFRKRIEEVYEGIS